MSRIFDALRNAGNDLVDPALVSFIEVSADEPEGKSPARTDGAPTSPAVESAPEVPTAPEEPARRICPIRVPNSAPLLPFGDLDFAAGEQYRIVRTKIIQHPKQPRLIVLSSPGSRDGKTVTAVNLAGALSLQSDGKVLLVDGDLRRSSIHALLGLPETPGLAEALRGICPAEDAWIQLQQFPSLYVMPAGAAKASPAELFDSNRWAGLCGKLRSSFKYIIVDSPPIAAVADYDLIQAACDGVIIVLRPDHTIRKLAFKALESVPREKLIGVVLNHLEQWFLSPSHSSHHYHFHAAASS
jgi:protein-tyrosine kinase